MVTDQQHEGFETKRATVLLSEVEFVQHLTCTSRKWHGGVYRTCGGCTYMLRSWVGVGEQPPTAHKQNTSLQQKIAGPHSHLTSTGAQPERGVGMLFWATPPSLVTSAWLEVHTSCCMVHSVTAMCNVRFVYSAGRMDCIDLGPGRPLLKGGGGSAQQGESLRGAVFLFSL